MFEPLAPLAADPILGLMALFQQDQNPNKVDLGVGVYKDEQGRTPVLPSVKEAEKRLYQTEDSKAYVGPAGSIAFAGLLSSLLLGEEHPVLTDDRLALVQTPGGCGALRVAAELIRAANPRARVWVSDPTWGNHIPLLGNSGLKIETYPYFDTRTNGVDFERMLQALSNVPRGDLVLLHACCHNPTGADLTPTQWQSVARLAEQRGFTPFVDIAYQGFGVGLDEDAFGLRLLAERLPEVVFAASCSKNFGVYRERVGAVGVIADTSAGAATVKSHLLSIIRGIYSMPPAHGAMLVAEVLENANLRQQWQQELSGMRQRINGLRRRFAEGMELRGAGGRFEFVNRQRGMFSFLGLTQEQVERLRRDFSIYLVGTGRASIAGLNDSNFDYVCDAVSEVVGLQPD